MNDPELSELPDLGRKTPLGTIMFDEVPTEKPPMLLLSTVGDQYLSKTVGL